jgi:hypothetical protein
VYTIVGGIIMETNTVKERIKLQLKQKNEKLSDEIPKVNWAELRAGCSKKVKVIKDSEETK